ncbi:MAG: hypothetical protein ACLP9L_18750 [Thermoguttaceae bacterium]
MRMRVLAIAIVGTCLLQASENIWAQNFNGPPWLPGPATDSTQSLGSFSMVLSPSISGAFVGTMGYTASTNIFTSPLLYDQNTQINRSATLTAGSPPYTNGLPVGTGGTGPIVSNSSVTVFPTDYTPPATGTDMVFTQINSFDLAGAGGVSVTAGTAAMDPNLPNSYGQVISNSGTPAIPANDFPARSFFDVFVDINLPVPAALGGGTVGLTNATVMSGTTALSPPGTPLVVSNSGITAFPPVVIYTHGNSSAVPLYIGPGGLNGTGQDAGDLVGLLVLAGHGAGYTPGTAGGATDENTGQPANETTFTNTLNQMLTSGDTMPVQPQYATWLTPNTPVRVEPEPSTISLLVAFVGAALAYRLRRRLQSR